MCAAQLAEGLPSAFKTLGCINWAWWHTPAVLALGSHVEAGDQMFIVRLCSELTASQGDMKPVSK